MRSPTEKMVETVARWYTPAVVGIAAVLASVPWAFGHDIGQVQPRSLSVLCRRA
jgi:cation transport ATPase